MGSDGVSGLCWELLSCFSQRGHSYAEQGPQMTTSQSRIGAGEVLVLGVSPSARQALILAGGTAWWGGGGRCRRRRWPGELVSDTFGPRGEGQGLAALVHTCVPSTHSPHVHRRRLGSEGDWQEVQSYRKLGLAFRPPTPAPRAEYSHFLKSESPPGDSELPEGT